MQVDLVFRGSFEADSTSRLRIMSTTNQDSKGFDKKVDQDTQVYPRLTFLSSVAEAAAGKRVNYFVVFC